MLFALFRCYHRIAPPERHHRSFWVPQNVLDLLRERRGQETRANQIDHVLVDVFEHDADLLQTLREGRQTVFFDEVGDGHEVVLDDSVVGREALLQHRLIAQRKPIDLLFPAATDTDFLLTLLLFVCLLLWSLLVIYRGSSDGDRLTDRLIRFTFFRLQHDNAVLLILFLVYDAFFFMQTLVDVHIECFGFFLLVLNLSIEVLSCGHIQYPIDPPQYAVLDLHAVHVFFILEIRVTKLLQNLLRELFFIIKDREESVAIKVGQGRIDINHFRSLFLGKKFLHTHEFIDVKLTVASKHAHANRSANGIALGKFILIEELSLAPPEH